MNGFSVPQGLPPHLGSARRPAGSSHSVCNSEAPALRGLPGHSSARTTREAESGAPFSYVYEADRPNLLICGPAFVSLSP